MDLRPDMGSPLRRTLRHSALRILANPVSDRQSHRQRGVDICRLSAGDRPSHRISSLHTVGKTLYSARPGRACGRNELHVSTLRFRSLDAGRPPRVPLPRPPGKPEQSGSTTGGPTHRLADVRAPLRFFQDYVADIDRDGSLLAWPPLFCPAPVDLHASALLRKPVSIRERVPPAPYPAVVRICMGPFPGEPHERGASSPGGRLFSLS